MAKRNPLYDFKWCPGCGDFGVKVALEQALNNRVGVMENGLFIGMAGQVVVAGAGGVRVIARDSRRTASV